MVNKHYPVQFKADAVALYRSRPGSTIAQIADDLGVNRETLRSWVRADDQQRGAAGGSAVADPRLACSHSLHRRRCLPRRRLEVVVRLAHMHPCPDVIDGCAIH